MTSLNKIQIKVNGNFIIKAAQFTEATKEQMIAINKYLGAQAFQEKYIGDILDSFNDGDKLIPLFYKNGYSSFIELKDWVYVRDGEVYATESLSKLADVMTKIANDNLK